MNVVQQKFVTLLCSDASEDVALCKALNKHLAPLRQNGWINQWQENDVPAGAEREREIETHLRMAQVILLLVSPDFLASESCDRQMHIAFQRLQAAEAIVIPILLRPANWENTLLKDLQVIPRDSKPIASREDTDQAMRDVTAEIEAVVKRLLKGVLLSHAPEDDTFAKQVQHDLETHGIPVLSFRESLTGTKNVNGVVPETISAAHLMLLLVSPQTHYAHLIKEDLQIADIYEKHIVPIWIDGDNWTMCAPPDLKDVSYIDARSTNYMTCIKQIITLYMKKVMLKSNDHSPSVDTSIPASNTEVLPPINPRNPYKGLRSFTQEDTKDFFGRDRFITELVQELRLILDISNDGQQKARLLGIIGPSGSGKSSIIMAGLLPRLKQGELPGSNSWLFLDPIVPGEHPLDELAITLGKKLPERSAAAIRKDLEETPSLHLLASQLSYSGETKVVLVVDQFEELFTLTTSEEERQHFIDVIMVAVSEPQGTLTVILTLRADFYDRPMQHYPILARALKQHCPVLPMDINDLRDVIRKPTKLPDVQLRFEGDLANDLLFELQGQAGALPLLQFTLDQLFQRRNGNLLTIEAYHALDGVRGALAKQAEDTYRNLPSDEHRSLTRALFMKLIDPTSTSEQDTTRRRAPLSEFDLTNPLKKQRLQETIDAFVKARLLTTGNSSGTATIEVSHEALIREWKRIAQWIRETPDDIQLQQTISKDVAEWQRDGRSADYLYRGSRLKRARVWEKRNPLISGNEAAFLRASVRRTTRTRITVASVFLILLVSIPLSILLIQSLLPPSPISVNTLEDSGPGSLRQAVHDAKPSSIISFASQLNGHTISLTSENLVFTKDLTLQGPEKGTLVISGTRSIVVGVGISVTISHLSFKNFHIVSDSVISNNGTMTLINSVITNNTVIPKFTPTGAQTVEGCITNSSNATIQIVKSTISANNIEYNSISNSGNPHVRTIPLANVAPPQEVIDNAGGTIILVDSTMSDNNTSAIHSYGGGSIRLKNSIISSNLGDLGIDVRDGSLALDTMTISNNSSAISTLSSKVTISNSTIHNNKGGGIVSFDDTLTLTNSTIYNNTRSTYGSGGAGVSIAGGQAHITFCTIYHNYVEGSRYGTTADGGGIFIESDSNNNAAKVTLSNSIVAGNHADGNGPDILGTFASNGYNLIQDPSGSIIQNTGASSDLVGQSPQLGPLKDNGGATWTLALASGSSGTDRIPLNICQVASTDQRGMKRPDENENMCDVGAFESSG